jgi:hypothetical protein
VSRRRPDDPEDRAYARALVLHRCPELTDADLALLGTQPVEPADAIAKAILDALAEVETRLDQLAAIVEDGDDDDADRRRGDRRAAGA